MVSEADPFRAYHRANRWMMLARRSAAVTGSVAVVTALCFAAAAAPPPAVASSPVEPPAVTESVLVDTLPAPAPETSVTPVVSEAAAPAPAGPAVWSIDIDTTGYQAEIDACLWVRMDVGAVAPLVGAHNFCGGEVVLRMAVGDLVTLTGTSLDGEYRVAESRDAAAGDIAATATDGMIADVILQTCYWHSNGRERLLALQRV